MSINVKPVANTRAKFIRPEKRGYTTAEAGYYIGRSASWLRKRRLQGKDDPGDPGPPYVKTPSGTTVYFKERLDEYLDNLDQESSKHFNGRLVPCNPV